MPTYAKPATDYPGQIAILASRGLVITDHAFAAHCLAHHNYYRLSAYRFPLTILGHPDQFQPGTTFEQLWALYDFDRQLRHLVHEACKRVEISVRSHWAYQVGHRHGAQAYENPHFKISLQPPISKPAHLIPSLDPVPTGVPHPMAPNRIYNTLVVLAHMMDIIQPNARWRQRVRDHIQIQAFPVAPHMGFPTDWRARPIWAP